VHIKLCLLVLTYLSKETKVKSGFPKMY